MSDLVGDLARLRQYATDLQRLMDELQEASPERAEGTDRSGAVRAVYGPDGLPETIRVSSYWKEKLPAAAFGAAVAEACHAAATQRGTEWSQALRRTGWQERLDRIEVDPARAAGTGPGPAPPAFRRPGSEEPPRSPAALAEDALRLWDRVTALRPRPRPQPPSSATCAIRNGALTLTLTRGGQVTCQADPRWAAQRSGAQLSVELRALLASARQALTPRTADDAGARAAVQTEADQLIAESLTALGQIGRRRNH